MSKAFANCLKAIEKGVLVMGNLNQVLTFRTFLVYNLYIFHNAANFAQSEVKIN